MPLRRDISGLDPAPGLLGAVVLHVVLYYLAGMIDPPENEEEEEIVEVEVIELPEPKKPEPKKPPPEIEKEEEPDPPKEQEQEQPKEQPKPKVQPKTKVQPKPEAPQKEAAPPPTPKRFELPPSETIPAGSGGDVKVNTGAGNDGGGNVGSPGGNGDKRGSGGGSGPGGGGTGTVPGEPWSPKNDLYISQQPKVLRVPELECPAVSERQVSGMVVLMVQVQRDGKVRSARVTQKMGHGCDEIAKKALRKAKFAPAIGTDGKAADYELRYEYEFELRD